MLSKFGLAAMLVLAAVVLVLALLSRACSQARLFVGGVRFETIGWELHEQSATAMLWTNREGDTLSLARGQGSGDLPPFDDLDSLRMRCRQLAQQSKGGLVSADILDLHDVQGVRLVYKRERLPAYGYTGMLIIPRTHHHFVIAVDSVERGTTGVRDTLVTIQLFKQGRLNPKQTDEKGRLEGWFRDPYDSQFDAAALRSVADDECYDSLVPSHPLSKVRRALRTIEDTLEFAR